MCLDKGWKQKAELLKQNLTQCQHDKERLISQLAKCQTDKSALTGELREANARCNKAVLELEKCKEKLKTIEEEPPPASYTLNSSKKVLVSNFE